MIKEYKKGYTPNPDILCNREIKFDVFLKYAQSDTNVYTVGFIRFLIGFLIIFPYISFKKFAVYKSKNLKLHITRAVLNVPMMILGFSSLVYIS